MTKNTGSPKSKREWRERAETLGGVVEEANPELWGVPSDQEMYRVFTAGSQAERYNLMCALRVLVARIRKARMNAGLDEAAMTAELMKA